MDTIKHQAEKEKKSFPRIAEGPNCGQLPPAPDLNFAAYVMEVIADYGNTVAIVDGETDDTRTFSFLVENVPRVAGGLKAAGVGLGDVVLMVSPNHVDFPLVMLSVVYCGATYAVVNSNLTPEGLCRVMRHCGTRWVVCHPSVLEKIEEAKSRLPSETIQQVWLVGEEGGQHSATLYKLMTSSPMQPVNKDDGLITEDMVAMMFFSSGTTGKPKGAMYSHLTLLNFVISKRCTKVNNVPDSQTKGDRQKILMTFSLSHAYGTVMVLLNSLAGTMTVILQRFSPEEYFQTIERYKITVSPVPPNVIDFLSKSPLLSKYDISSVTEFACTGSHLPNEVANVFKEKTGQRIVNSYGLTEGLIVSSNNKKSFKLGSAGRILPYVKVKVIDTETGDMLGEYDEGEVCVQSPFIMIGYIDNSEATRDVIDPQGWLHTGDVGYFDEDNFLFLTDRLKDVIKFEGYQVYPAQIESVILGHEEVKEAAVIGVPDARFGEAPRACVVLVPGSHLQSKQLQDYVNSRVNPGERLTGGVEMMASLPRNDMGKILKRKLKQDFIATQTTL